MLRATVLLHCVHVHVCVGASHGTSQWWEHQLEFLSIQSCSLMGLYYILTQGQLPSCKPCVDTWPPLWAPYHIGMLSDPIPVLPYIKCAICACICIHFMLELFSLQAQIGGKFSDANFASAYNCESYFSHVSLMGVVSILILLVFLYCSTVFMFQMKSPDRFDDPRGPTISVENLH